MSAVSSVRAAVKRGLFLLLLLGPVLLRAQTAGVPRYISTAEDIALAEMVLQDLGVHAQEESGPALMIRAAKQLLGQPYVAGTQEGREERLRIFLTKTDCILFTETCLGLVRTAQRCGPAATFEDLAASLRDSRYRRGLVEGYSSRLHYTTEWIAQGVERGLFRDVTPGLGGVPDTRPIRFMSRHPDSYAPLKGESGYARENLRQIRAMEERVSGMPRCFIPKDKLGAVEDRIRSGDILCLATSIDGLDYSHVVIAYREKPGAPLGFIHASTSAKKVIIEPRSLQSYLQANSRATGISVLRVSE